METLITGGAGFIGSHVGARLLSEGHEVTIVDDLSGGHRDRIPTNAEFVQADLTEQSAIDEIIDDSFDCVYHLASQTAVNDDAPRQQFRENTLMTYGLVEAVLESKIPEIVFTSTSTVYGEAPRPTPEDYAPLEPISTYGASKLACEGILSTAAHSHGLTVRNFRFANIVGQGLRGAVIPDFIEKLRDDPSQLEILGDGRQEKSYMHVSDCIDAMFHAQEHATGPIETFNLGTRTTTSVTRIADIVSNQLGVDPEYHYTGGKRGWTGDVPKMRLSIEKLAGLGWEPELSSQQAVELATEELLREL